MSSEQRRWKKVDEHEVRGRLVSPYVSITTSRIRLNSSASEKLGKDVDYVQLFIDGEDPAVAMKPADKSEEDAVNIVTGKRDQAKYINSKKFSNKLRKLAHCDHDDGKSHKFPAKWSDDDGMLIVDLTDEIS